MLGESKGERKGDIRLATLVSHHGKWCKTHASKLPSPRSEKAGVFMPHTCQMLVRAAVGVG